MITRSRARAGERAADQVHARLADFLQVRPARSGRAAVADPARLLPRPRRTRRRWRSRAARARVRVQRRSGARPARGRRDALGGRVRRAATARLLKVESELGTQLAGTARARRAARAAWSFPAPRAELMFAPVESLPFAVDLSLNARFLPNELAIRIARRRIQDADQIMRAESDGEQGVSDLGVRAHAGGEGPARLSAGLEPPAAAPGDASLAVGAAGEGELEERVEMCRRAYGEIRLHRPLGDQLQLFLQHLPGQRTRVRGLRRHADDRAGGGDDADRHARGGSRRGFYLGHTLSGSRQPVRFNLSEGSESNRNTAVLCVGALGTGKTTLAQKLTVRGLSPGRARDRLRPEGRPPLPPARGGPRPTSSA